MGVQSSMPETAMSLVPSLLQAILRVDGEALVMHVGEKPYVVSPNGQIDLATRGLTFDAVHGLVSQLLPSDAMRSLDEVGAAQFDLPLLGEFPGEHFTVTAARGGDDLWAEIRRRPAQDDLLTSDLFAGFVAPTTTLVASASGELADAPSAAVEPHPSESTPSGSGPQDSDRVDDLPKDMSASRAPLVETVADSSALPASEASTEDAGPIAPDIQPAASVTPDPGLAVTPEPGLGVMDTDPSVAAAAPEAALLPEPVTAQEPEPSGTGAIDETTAALAPGHGDAPEEPNESQKAIASWLAAFSPTHLRQEPASQARVPALPSFVRAADGPMPSSPTMELPGAAGPVLPDSHEPVAADRAEALREIPETTPESEGLDPDDVPSVAAAAATLSIGAAAEPEVSLTTLETEPSSLPVTPPASAVLDGPGPDRASESVMSTQSSDLHSFAGSGATSAASIEPERLSVRAAATSAPAPVELVAQRADAAFAPFPALGESLPGGVVVPMARSGRETVADGANASLERLLRLAASRGATALYLASGARPSARLDGDVQLLDGTAALSASEIDALLLGFAPEAPPHGVQGREWLWELSDLGAVRCTSFRDHRGPGAVFRIMPVRPQSASHLGLSREIQSLVGETDGLVLVSGPRASGKSTLVSSLVDLINRTRRDYVITIESEVNVVHGPQGAFISQREVRGGSDEAVAVARAALREDPDVLVIDDLRTAALMGVALDAAANGQLVIGGVPAPHASAAVERLIDLYQPEQRRHVQLALAQHLRGVVSQVLLRKSGGGRVAAREVLLNTPMVASLLAEGRVPQLPLAIEGGRKHGMVPLNDALVGFVQSGAVDVREAYRRAADRASLVDLLKRQGIDTSFVERLA